MKLHEALNHAQYGDQITVVRSNLVRNLSSTVSGPALVSGGSEAVGIDLFDGDPHCVRMHGGHVYGDVVEVVVTRDDVEVVRWSKA